MAWSVYTWTKDGLIELGTAHDKADAERARDDLAGRPCIPGKPLIAPTRERRGGTGR
jgi:hypothetical protein